MVSVAAPETGHCFVVVLFLVSAAWAVLGNLLLFAHLYSRRAIPFALGGLALFLYWRLPLEERTRTTSFIAITAGAAIVMAVASAILLFPMPGELPS